MIGRLILVSFVCVFSLILVNSGLSAEIEAPDNSGEVAPAEDVPWIWGDVKAVDITSSVFKINYLDYQTDEEKEITLGIDQDTKFENAGNLGEVKAGDIVSVEYAVRDGKNVAKNISVEKVDVSSEVPESPSLSDTVETK